MRARDQKLESDYQTHVLERIRRMFRGCLILKNDSGYIQGIPDWTIFYRDKWAMLEVKARTPTSERDFRPNQPWYLVQINEMSFAACIYPENEEEVLHALQQTFQPRRAARVSKRK